jgi:hypothetical protein
MLKMEVFKSLGKWWGNKKANSLINNKIASIFVPTTGFEPAHLMAPPPQDGMSTNFTTWALFSAKIMKTKKDTLVE